jgi:hypothetical protein
MKESETIRFVDLASHDEGCAIIRYNDEQIGLGLSLQSNGDIEIIISKNDARKLIDALMRATQT